MDILKSRSQVFQKYVFANTEKQNRADFAVNLRKAKRLEGIKKQRFFISQNFNLESLPLCIKPSFPLLKSLPESEKLLILRNNIEKATNKEDLLDLLKFLKSLVSSKSSCLELIVSLEFVPIIVKFLNLANDPQIIDESALILCNLGIGEDYCMNALYFNHCIEAFFIILECKSLATKETAILGLSNMLAHRCEYFEVIIESGLLKKLCKICKVNDSTTLFNVIA